MRTALYDEATGVGFCGRCGACIDRVYLFWPAVVDGEQTHVPICDTCEESDA